MQKIMYDNQYGLEKAVLEKYKQLTRRLIPQLEDVDNVEFSPWKIGKKGRIYITASFDGQSINIYPKYHPGEIVAVAQNLRDMGYDPNARPAGHIWGLDHTAAWTNKMFVSASQCIHQIRIEDVRVEKLRDISAQDCLKEGIYRKPIVMEDHDGLSYHDSGYTFTGTKLIYRTPWDAFAVLIDKISGKGTWEKNPWVFVYKFSLVK